jgi:pimeloyl-ACP methyl ester carboxylesterase
MTTQTLPLFQAMSLPVSTLAANEMAARASMNTPRLTPTSTAKAVKRDAKPAYLPCRLSRMMTGGPDGGALPARAVMTLLRRGRRLPGSVRLRRRAAADRAQPSMRGYAAQLYSIAGWTSVQWLRCLRQRTLVLAGDDDPIVPVVNGRILAHLIPDARLHVVRGGGHLFVLEDPAAVAARVSEFLSEPRAATSAPPG